MVGDRLDPQRAARKNRVEDLSGCAIPDLFVKRLHRQVAHPPALLRRKRSISRWARSLLCKKGPLLGRGGEMNKLFGLLSAGILLLGTLGTTGCEIATDTANPIDALSQADVVNPYDACRDMTDRPSCLQCCTDTNTEQMRLCSTLPSYLDQLACLQLNAPLAQICPTTCPSS
jgi:hypothetical protein